MDTVKKTDELEQVDQTAEERERQIASLRKQARRKKGVILLVGAAVCLVISFVMDWLGQAAQSQDALLVTSGIAVGASLAMLLCLAVGIGYLILGFFRG